MVQELVSIFITVIACIAQISVLCIAGYFAALRGVIDSKGRKLLNQLNLGLFTPALLFGKVAFSLTPQKLISLWVVPVGFLLVTSISAIAGWSLSSLFGLNHRQRAITVSASMYMNTNTIPVAVIQSLSLSLPILRSGPDDKPEDQLGRTLSYLLIYGILGSFVRWSLGVKLFEYANQSIEHNPHHHHPDYRRELEKLESNLLINSVLPHTPTPTSHPSQEEPMNPHSHSLVSSPPHLDSNLSEGDDHDLIVQARSCIDLSSQATYRESTATDQTLIEGFDQEIHPQENPSKPSQDLFRILISFLGLLKRLKSLFNPPLLSAIAAVIVACISPLQAFISKIESLRHLLNITGNVSIPLTLVALGSYFYQPSSLKSEETETDSNKETSNEEREEKSEERSIREERLTIVLSLISRQLIAPLILIPILASFVIYSNHQLSNDPVFILTSSLVIGGPPAMTLAQMTTRTCPRFDRVISRMLLWSFTCVTPLTTMALTSAALYIQSTSR